MLRVEYAAHLHLAIRARDCVRIDREINSDAPHRGKLVTSLESTSSNRRLDLVNQLAINRDTGMGVKAKCKISSGELQKSIHNDQCTSQLVHCQDIWSDFSQQSTS